MGHGKETPRQKMIGMMYLVLTAMLALNVSAEVLDAFRLVDEGIKNTTENFYKKNQLVYQEFHQKFAENEQKVGPWKNKADSVRLMADQLFNHLQDLKLELIKVTHGDTSEVISNGRVVNQFIQGPDKYDDATRIMVGENKNGKAFDLKKKIDDYRNFLLSYVDEEDVRVIDAISSALNTEIEEDDSEHGELTGWEVKHFYHIPLGAVMPVLSKLQADVRNTESEILNYLFERIDAGSFSFNKLEVTIIPNSSYIIEGNEYKADVFLAAVDTTAPPIVYIGDYDSTQNEEGIWEYNMIGNYDSLTVEGGRGKYSAMGSRVGTHDWSGIIKLRGPDGGFIQKRFERSFQVAKPNVVVSPTKMNVFYVGVPNPVSISAAGIQGDKIFPSITNGIITKKGDGEYIVKPRRPGNSLITVIAEIDGERKSMGVSPFRVKSLPTPVVQVAEKSGGRITRNVLAAQAGIFAVMEDFEFDLEYTITEFTVSTTDKGGYYVDHKAKGNIFTKAQQDLIKGLRRGTRVNFEDVKAIGPDGVVKDLAPIVFEII